MSRAGGRRGGATWGKNTPRHLRAYPPFPLPPNTRSGFIKSVVFGGLDGIITTFSIIAAVAGASLAMEVVLLMGFANLIADAISMGLGDFLSEKAELTFLRAEYDREAWEFENFPEGEINEMVALYKEKGVGEEDARAILTAMAKYPTLFVEHMFNVEIGEMRPSDDENPAMNGFVTFCSFIIFGAVPVVAYAIQWGAHYNDKQGAFGVTCAVTALTMFALGAVQAHITRQAIVRAGLTMMCNGSLAAAAAYLVGWGLEQAIGRGEC